jgi:hypothetical protein
MANAEAKMYADAIIGKIDRIVACLDGRTDEEISRTPPVPNANSLRVLAVHTMGNVEEAIFEILHGQPVNRDRDAEFSATARTADDVRNQWNELHPRVREAIESMDETQLGAKYDDHRRGPNTGRGLLLLTATHASEHVGHAELTRDWIDAD